MAKIGREDAGASRSPPAVWPSIPPAPVASARNPLLDGRWDFPPLSLRPTLCRAGQTATGRDARGYLKLSTRYSCWSRRMSGTWRGQEGTCGDPRLRAVNRRLAPTQVRILVLPPQRRPAQTCSPSGPSHATPLAWFRSNFAPPDASRTRSVLVARGQGGRSAPAARQVQRSAGGTARGEASGVVKDRRPRRGRPGDRLVCWPAGADRRGSPGVHWQRAGLHAWVTAVVPYAAPRVVATA
jgi:hypothetical protein